MSYLTQTRIAADPHLILRVAACAASVGVLDPQFWAQERMMAIAVTPGWAEAYAGADGLEPGADESAVTDAMILTAVESLRAAQPSSPAQ